MSKIAFNIPRGQWVNPYPSGEHHWCWGSCVCAKYQLTHWGRVMHICVSKLTLIVSDNGLSPDRRQAIIWTNSGLLLIGPLGTNFSEIYIEILTFSLKKMCLKVSSAKRRPFCLGLNVLRDHEGYRSNMYIQWDKYHLIVLFSPITLRAYIIAGSFYGILWTVFFPWNTIS